MSKHSSTPTGSSSDLSIGNTDMGETEKNKGLRTETLMETQLHHSRFLKKKQCAQRNQLNQMATAAMQKGTKHVTKIPVDTASKVRSNAILRKLAQIESKIMTRKVQMDLADTALALKTSDENSVSSSLEHTTRSSRYLKRNHTVNENVTSSKVHFKKKNSHQTTKNKVPVRQQLGLNRDEEEMRQLLESSLEFSSENVNWKANTNYSKPDEKSPGSIKDSIIETTSPRTNQSKQSQKSLSERSEIKSLDELFLKGANTEEATSESSNYFRLNILNIDDLDSNVSSDTEELKQVETDMQMTKKSSKDLEPNVFHMSNNQTPLKVASALTSTSTASHNDMEGASITEEEISEVLSGIATDYLKVRQVFPGPEESTVNSDYSEDFEKSLSLPEPETTDRRSLSEMSVGHSNSSVCSSKDLSPSVSSFQPKEKGDKTVNRVTVKEIAVQTTESPFTYYWSNSNGTAIFGPDVGCSYIDPVPIASHVVTVDAIEALTTYSPAAFALNDMLQQHLILTQQLVETIHHLHLSLVESLERETFQYHTLAEAKEYIKSHKSPPLTIEQALKKIKKK
ncbi:uncharacterized protein C19orf44 homolog [Carettochelys insculpta]|uniref:uncharacterized protein C19orf44 homolog n=1 Tax=Carettochelys insculpta TaxID=44489 RepID=UPI003EBA2F8C